MYLTTQEAKKFNIESINAMEDGKLELMLELYSGVIDEYCRTRFISTQAKQISDVRKKIRLEHTPLLEVSAIEYMGYPLKENEDYYVYPELNLIELSELCKYKKNKRSLKISYVYGYDKISAIVKKSLIALIKLNSEFSNVDNSIQSESFDSEYSYSRSSQSLEQKEKDILSALDKFIQREYELINEGTTRARWV